MPKDDNKLLWIWLSLACRTGSALPSTLLKYFSSPERIFGASEEDYRAVDTNFYGHEKDLCNKDLSRAESILEYCRANEIGIATPEDYFYPESFRRIPNKPIVLYYLGNFCDTDTAFTAGIVGARQFSEYGLHAAKRISYDLARSGAVIVSGMAAGIDAAAHRAALYCGAKTIGFLGCGIDRVYPRENAPLYEEVIRHGLLMTEYPPGSAPLGKHFPVRNRLIAAISDAVCVIEGREESGSLITAEDALKFGKVLYSVPGSIFSSVSAGSNFLLKVGAKPLLSAFDVLDDFKEKYPALEGSVSLFREKGKEEKKERQQEKKAKKKPESIKKKIGEYVFTGLRRLEKEEEPIPPKFTFVDISASDGEIPGEAPSASADSAAPSRRAAITQLDESQRAVYNKLSFDPVLPDKLVDENLSPAEVMAILTKLEIMALACKAPGGKFVLADRAEE